MTTFMPYDASVLRGSSDLVSTRSALTSPLYMQINRYITGTNRHIVIFTQRNILFMYKKCNSDIAHVSTNTVYECKQSMWKFAYCTLTWTLHMYMQTALSIVSRLSIVIQPCHIEFHLWVFNKSKFDLFLSHLILRRPKQLTVFQIVYELFFTQQLKSFKGVWGLKVAHVGYCKHEIDMITVNK